MGNDVIVVPAREGPPDRWDAAVFSPARPPGARGVGSWRPGAHAELRARSLGGGRLVVFDPEHREARSDDYGGQIEREERCLHLADEVEAR